MVTSLRKRLGVCSIAFEQKGLEDNSVQVRTNSNTLLNTVSSSSYVFGMQQMSSESSVAIHSLQQNYTHAKTPLLGKILSQHSAVLVHTK